jgi:N6-adenosine-specific RNA methylase IME4/predicted nucleic acid-binding Zn ribbon protein
MPEPEAMSYGVILADPPWRYRVWSRNHGRRTAESFYPTMSSAELCALRPRVDVWAAEECALFLWVTAPVLPEALKLIEAWGFIYKTIGFTWVKVNKKNGKPFTGMGHYTRANAEICLLATRGKPRVKAHDINQVISAPRREHSRKPDEQYPRIMQLFEGPYLELFARARWQGWKVWGLEAPDQSQGAATLDEVSELSVTDNHTTCVICGGTFIARHGAKTCSAKCRQSAYRRRVTDKRNIGEWFLPTPSNTHTPSTESAPDKASSSSVEAKQDAISTKDVQTSPGVGVGDNTHASLPPVVNTPAAAA